MGDVTPERLRILRDADTIVVSEMKASEWYYRVWQSFAVMLPIRSVGVMGDERTYENTIALRIVESQDGMTADWVRLPYEFLEGFSTRIINEVKGVNRVCYDMREQAASLRSSGSKGAIRQRGRASEVRSQRRRSDL